MASVDVVVPCYNYGRFLETCIRSIIRQDGVSVRVLIIDDASTDNSPDVGRRLASEDDRVHFRRHESNAGHIATYNEGLLEWAASDYVLLISADDVVAPGALARAAGVMDCDLRVGLCFGQEVVFENEVPEVDRVDNATAEVSVIDGGQLIEMACDAADNPVPTPTAVVRTSVQKRLGGYKKELPHTADLDMWLRFAANGHVAMVPTVQAFKREHSANMLKQFTPKILPDLKQRFLAFESAFVELRDQIANADELLAKATQRISDQAFWGAHALFERGDVEFVQQLLDFALELNPRLEDSRQWRRFVWKRRMGLGTWRAISGLTRGLRGVVGPTS